MIAIAIVLTLLLVAGLPISYAFALAGSFALWFTGEQQLNVISRMFSGLDTFVLMAAINALYSGSNATTDYTSSVTSGLTVG